MTTQAADQPADRDELIHNLRKDFPHLAASDVDVSQLRGGRASAERLLAEVKPQSYERSRNYLSGDVTRLSAYLRHGVLTLAEVRDAVLRKVQNPQDAGKLVQELAWRDYWQRLYDQLGDRIWQDREAYKTGYPASAYAAQLPEDVREASTTLSCIDSFVQQLQTTGYLHNHARMWFAAYLVHFRKTRWQAGARWFLEHLLDGDPASNNLSWQWVASTFASKPYFFNRENLERYTAGVFCSSCPHAQAHTCPFDHDYETLEQTLFPRLHEPVSASTMPSPPLPHAAGTHKPSPQIAGSPLLWMHTDALNPKSPMLLAHPDRPRVFIWDRPWIVDEQIKLKRLLFLAECLQEMPGKIDVRIGDPAAELLAAARASAADYVLAQRTPDPRLLAAATYVERHLPVVWYDPPPFVETPRSLDLKRFSRYWQRVQSSAMHITRTT
jgi:deoxyribodipyrimidine photo-lyase